MMRTDTFSDLHVHLSDEDIDMNIAMLKSLSDYGLKDVNIAAINYLISPPDENLRALYLKKTFQGANLSVFGGLYYLPYINHFGIPFLKQAETLLAMGCDGIKLIENKPSFRKHNGFGLNSKLYDAMFDMLEEKQVPILCHINDPEEFWSKEQVFKWPNGPEIVERGWLYDTPDYLTYKEIFNEMLERLNKNPNLNIVFAHFMFLSENIETAEKMVTAYPHLKFDLTPGWEMYEGFRKNYDNWRIFFEKYSDRILYGTDTSHYPITKEIHQTVRYAIGGDPAEITMPHVYFAHMRGFDLTKEAQENIAHRNFEAFIGKTKPVNTELVISEMNAMIRRIKNNDGDLLAAQRLERMAKELSDL